MSAWTVKKGFHMEEVGMLSAKIFGILVLVFSVATLADQNDSPRNAATVVGEPTRNEPLPLQDNATDVSTYLHSGDRNPSYPATGPSIKNDVSGSGQERPSPPNEPASPGSGMKKPY